jgi:hypothetical protein
LAACFCAFQPHLDHIQPAPINNSQAQETSAATKADSLPSAS